MGKIFSPGKLMLTSEYAALDGALVLAVPTKLGQDFFFEELHDEGSTIYWKAHHQGKLWLEAEIDYRHWKVIKTNLPDAAAFILKVLQNVQLASESKFKTDISYHLSTNLQFPADYGLGSSSTLMNNLADWANIDAFQLNDRCLGGSGYDIAVAKEKSPILFRMVEDGRIFNKINYSPAFKDELIFIHLNRKQNSREGIGRYRSLPKSEELVQSLSQITERVLACDTILDFSELMRQHEALLSRHLGIPTVAQAYFPDCPVFIKSLGAWGGDFVMSQKFPGFDDYFGEKNFPSIFSWNEIIV